MSRLLSVAVAIVGVAGMIALASSLGASAEVPPDSALGRIRAIPVCGDLPERTQVDDFDTLSEVVDSQTGETILPAVPTEDHFAAPTDIFEAEEHLSWFMALPAQIPDWVECQAAELTWGADGDSRYGTLALSLLDDSSWQTANREMLFQVTSSAPSMPPPNGNFVPVPAPMYADTGLEAVETLWEDLGPDAKDDTTVEVPDQITIETPEVHPDQGTRIVWESEQGLYFELIGPFDLAEAIKIADSVEPAVA